MLGKILEMILYTGIFYGIIGTLTVGGIIIGIHHLIGKKGKNGEQR